MSEDEHNKRARELLRDFYFLDPKVVTTVAAALREQGAEIERLKVYIDKISGDNGVLSRQLAAQTQIKRLRNG